MSELKENVEDYLRKHSVLDGQGNMDGSFVPLSVAMIAIEQCLEGKNWNIKAGLGLGLAQDVIIEGIEKRT